MPLKSAKPSYIYQVHAGSYKFSKSGSWKAAKKFQMSLTYVWISAMIRAPLGSLSTNNPKEQPSVSAVEEMGFLLRLGLIQCLNLLSVLA